MCHGSAGLSENGVTKRGDLLHEAGYRLHFGPPPCTAQRLSLSAAISNRAVTHPYPTEWVAWTWPD